MDCENVKEALVHLIELGEAQKLEKRNPVTTEWEPYTVADLQEDICGLAYDIADWLGIQDVYLKKGNDSK